MKCGPDNCPILGYETLSPAAKKEARTAKALTMSNEGFTYEQIGLLFGVSKKTISLDLQGIVTPGNNQKPVKTASNPKGAGRHKGGGNGVRKRKTSREQHDVAVKSRQHGKTQTEAAKDAGLGSVQTVKIAESYDEGWADCLKKLDVDPETLALTAKAKLDAAKQMIERSLKAEHAARMREVEEEVRQRVVERSKEHLKTLNEMEEKAKESEAYYQKLINRNKPIFTGDQFRSVLMCLHPDGQRTTEKLHEAFRLFNDKKLQLTGEK
ncbi:MAG TPA: hypothetical protein VGG61_04565 [Gemmataceae bacterium]|jgi:hypothetical protein